MRAQLLKHQRRFMSGLAAVVLIFSILLYAAPPVQAAPTIEWTAHATAEADLWWGVTWSPELNLFAAVSVDGTNRVMTSPDGINWTGRIAAEANEWISVTWAPELSLFVAVAGSGTNRVMTSPDGINWTARAAAEANQWRFVTWSPDLNLLVAVSADGTNRVMTSPDGINWTARMAAEANPWWSVTWSPELSKFVAVASSGTNRVMTSPDGINWTGQTAAEANSWISVKWVPELSQFVAVGGSGTNRVMTSPDGINWTARMAAEANSWRSVAWSPEIGLFVAVSSTGTNRIMTSPDGINWTAQMATEASFWVSVTWSPELGKFVATAATGTNVMVGEVLDHDGIANDIEDAAPNGGDANNDGTRDRFQSHATSLVDPVNNKYAALEVDEACQNNSVAVVSESDNATVDPGFNYPAGMMDFTTDCGTPGFTATVVQYYYGVTNNNFVMRKYNPNTNAYFTVDDATLEQVAIDGQTAVKVTYEVTDGGELDIDGTADGIIVDPAGLAEQAVGVPNTGLGGTVRHN